METTFVYHGRFICFNSLSILVTKLVTYLKKLRASDWLEAHFYLTRVQSCNTSANYK